MKVKLNKAQMEAMQVLLRVMLDHYTPKTMAENLLDSLVRQVWEKVTIKLTKSVSEQKVKHTLNMTATEAMGLHLWFHQLITEDFYESYKYESLVCRNVVNQIDKEYA